VGVSAVARVRHFLFRRAQTRRIFHRDAERNEEQNIRTQEQSEDGPLRKLEFKETGSVNETAENPRV
jgi:hypothetical protein